MRADFLRYFVKGFHSRFFYLQSLNKMIPVLSLDRPRDLTQLLGKGNVLKYGHRTAPRHEGQTTARILGAGIILVLLCTLTKVVTGHDPAPDIPCPFIGLVPLLISGAHVVGRIFTHHRREQYMPDLPLLTALKLLLIFFIVRA